MAALPLAFQVHSKQERRLAKGKRPVQAEPAVFYIASTEGPFNDSTYILFKTVLHFHI